MLGLRLELHLYTSSTYIYVNSLSSTYIYVNSLSNTYVYVNSLSNTYVYVKRNKLLIVFGVPMPLCSPHL